MENSSSYSPKAVLLWLLRQGRPYWPLQLSMVVISVLGTLVTLGTTEVMRQLVNAGVGKDLSLATKTIKIATIIFLSNILLNFVRRLINAYFSSKVTKDFEKDCYTKSLRAKQEDLDAFHSADLIERIESSAPMALKGVSWKIVELFERVLTIIMQISYMVSIDIRLTWLAFIFAVVGPLLVIILAKKIRKTNDQLYGNNAKLQSLNQDIFQGLEIAKAYSIQSWLLEKLKSLYVSDVSLNRKSAVWSSTAGLMNLIVTAAGLLSIMALGGKLAILGIIDLGAVLAMVVMYEQVGNPIIRLTGIWPELQKSIAQGKRARDLFLLPAEDEKRTTVSPESGSLVFQDVTFGYNETEKVLKGVNFTVEPGHMVALVGPSGSGKSTILKLLLRLYTPEAGEIIWHDNSLETYDLVRWRQKVAYIPQTPLIFAGTVRENLVCDLENISEDQVREASKAARIHEVIEALPEGYNTYLGEKGKGLSGGELQRLVLARVFLRKPQLLLLDEATSALDSVNEKAIQEAIKELFPGRTTLVVTHRLQTVQKAQEILYLENGQIREQGNYHQLMALDGRFANVVRSGELGLGEVENVG